MGVLFLSTDESLDRLLASAQAATTDDTEAMAVILNRFDDLAMSIARSLTSNDALQQDTAQGARLGLVQAVRKHRLGTAGFPAYAKRYMIGAARRTLMSMLACEASIDPADYEWLDQPERDAVPDTTAELMDMITVLSPEQQAVTLAYYVHDQRLDDIAATLQISKSAVSQRLSTIHRVLRPIVELAVAA